MKTLLGSLLLLLACIAPASAGQPRRLTFEGLDPVRIGMSFRAAERALGAPLVVDYPEANPSVSCGIAHQAHNRNPGVSYMIEGGRIRRIDIDSAGAFHPAVRTAAGLGLGSSEAAARKTYGPKLIVQPHPYDEDGHYLVVKTPGKRRGLIFVTSQGRVTSFRSGAYPAVGYIEGCL